MERQIGEAHLIDDTPRRALINSKAEWGHNTIPRLKVEAESEEIGRPHHDQQQQPLQQQVAPTPAEEPIQVPAKRHKYQMTDYFGAEPKPEILTNIQRDEAKRTRNDCKVSERWTKNVEPEKDKQKSKFRPNKAPTEPVSDSARLKRKR